MTALATQVTGLPINPPQSSSGIASLDAGRSFLGW
jgi:hypothetical protein